ncbi:hypothetical protein [Parvularcula maris]|uniref:Uncharacterized protein n=1 Tax=Parvularcula maris TaxID=2965077 RepID=A0A9X2L9A2_9PROT|nr:hypothetical protein [Parvularcula maris]MCQ8185293.1 hypothetical protein [Parvularcula maris]
MKRVFMLGVGGFLTVMGVILTISPVPLGFVLAFFGLGLMIMHSPRMAAWVRFNRTYNDTVDKHATYAAKHMPGKVGQALDRTSPHRDYEGQKPVASPAE